MSHIFISYSREDRVNAEMLANRLKEVHHKTWLDVESITGGEEWRKSLDTALDNAFVLIVLLTPASIASTWVRYECDAARTRNLTIVPLLMRRCDVPDYLEDIQHIDFLTGFDSAFEKLNLAVSTIKKRSNENKVEQPPASELSVLVVEDSSDIQELIRDICLEFGTKVDIASNRSEAAQLIKFGDYHFITLDMQLGITDTEGESGLFLLELWKEYQPDTPLVIISKLPWDRKRMRDFLIEYKVMDVLDKPIDMRVLRKHLRDTLSKIP